MTEKSMDSVAKPERQAAPQYEYIDMLPIVAAMEKKGVPLSELEKMAILEGYPDVMLTRRSEMKRHIGGVAAGITIGALAYGIANVLWKKKTFTTYAKQGGFAALSAVGGYLGIWEKGVEDNHFFYQHLKTQYPDLPGLVNGYIRNKPIQRRKREE